MSYGGVGGVGAVGSDIGAGRRLGGAAGGGMAMPPIQQQQQQALGGLGGQRVNASTNASPSQHVPSKVLHVRGLPPYTSESDLLTFFSSLPGMLSMVPTRLLLLPNTSQALVQLPSIDAAATILNFQDSQGGMVPFKAGKSIIMQYANRQEIHTQGSGGGQRYGGLGPSSTGGGGESQQAPNRVLLLSVYNVRVPVTLDHIHQILKPYGEVLRIITFHKAAVYKALVELATVEQAAQAKVMLEGKDIFANCCHLRIGYSSLPSLVVKSAGSNARDFTSPTGATLNATPGTTNPTQHAGATSTVANEMPVQQQQHPSMHGGFGAEGGGSSVYHGSVNAGPYQQSPGLISGAGGYATNAPTYTDTYSHASHPHATHPSHMHAPTHPTHSSVAASSATQHQPPSHPHPHAVPHPGATPLPVAPGCVVLVSNLPDTATCDMLFTLFGVYGDVIRVKILYNKRDTALVQYMSPQSAYLASLHLNHLQLYGKQLSVTPSKHVEVAMPKAASGTGAAGLSSTDQEHQASLTQDYTHSPIHRFKRTSGAAGTITPSGQLGLHAKSIHPPSSVLHVSSLADGVTEEDLRQLFAQMPPPPDANSTNNANGTTADEKSFNQQQQAPVVQFFTTLPRSTPAATPAAAAQQPPQSKPSKQAFLRFPSISAAVHALLTFHNYNLQGRYLRISFSGKDPNQVHDTIDAQPIQDTNHDVDQQQQHDQQQQQQQHSPQSHPASATSSPQATSTAAPSSLSPSHSGVEGQESNQE